MASSRKSHQGRHVRRLSLVAAVMAMTVSFVVPVSSASAHVGGRPTPGHGPASPIRGQAAPSAPVPTVAGPIPGAIPSFPPPGAGLSAVTPAVLAAYGYQEKEFFLSGRANAYDFSRPATSGGRWSIRVAPGSAAAYRTRIEVYTPKNPKRFNGNVVVEWDNVSAGADLVPDLVYDHNTPFRAGEAYVGVSAQFVGVESAKRNDPGRYGTLVQPGDSYSYDIFSQAGMAVWRDAARVLGGLRPVALIADGESQSAGRLTTYIDAFARLFNVYDGYLLHSRGPAPAALQQAPANASVAVGGPTTLLSVPNGNVGLTTVNTPPVTLIRTDLLAPVLTFESQTDVHSPPYAFLGYGPATQADSAGFRLWEVGGTSHLDDCLLNLCPNDTGDIAGARARFNDMLNPPTTSGFFPACLAPINTGEQGYVLGAARQQLTRWVVTGGVRGGFPAAAPPLFAGQYVGELLSPPPVFDANGNIVGGVRSPAIDVPVATLTGVPTNTPGLQCALEGTTIPFTASKLRQLYPTHAAFVWRWALDVLRLTREGYLTVADAANLVEVAEISSVS